MGDDGIDKMGIEEIIRELEEDLTEGDYSMEGENDKMEGEYPMEGEHNKVEEMYSADSRGADNPNPGSQRTGYEINENSSIDELIEAILAEEDKDPKEEMNPKKKEMNAEEEKDEKAAKNEKHCFAENKELKS